MLATFRKFLNAVYDDFAVAGEGDGAFISARVVRAWRVMLGPSAFDQQIETLIKSGSIAPCGGDNLEPDLPMFEVKFYIDE